MTADWPAQAPACATRQAKSKPFMTAENARAVAFIPAQPSIVKALTICVFCDRCYPPSAMNDDARVHPRYEIDASADVPGSGTHRIQNISLGGICIQTSAIEEVGAP